MSGNEVVGLILLIVVAVYSGSRVLRFLGWLWHAIMAPRPLATYPDYRPPRSLREEPHTRRVAPAGQRVAEERGSVKPPSVVAPVPVVALPLEQWWHRVIRHATHVILVGESQSGKSTTARALLTDRSYGDRVVIIDPHEKLNDWGDLPVIGRGYDKAACATAIKALYVEMGRRYQPGEAIEPPLTVFIDEYPAIAKYDPSVSEAFTGLLREAAKVHIRLVVLAQDDNVKSLGIEGEGEVRKNLLKVLLGTFATAACPDAATLAQRGHRPAALVRHTQTAAVSCDGLLDRAGEAVGMWVAWEGLDYGAIPEQAIAPIAISRMAPTPDCAIVAQFSADAQSEAPPRVAHIDFDQLARLFEGGAATNEAKALKALGVPPSGDPTSDYAIAKQRLAEARARAKGHADA